MKNVLSRLFLVGSLGLFSVVSLPACGVVAAAIPVLTEIATVLADAGGVLDMIDVLTQDVFRRTNPSEDVRAKYQDTLLKAYNALNAAQKAVSGASALTQEQYETAFADFKVAYLELENLLKSFGINPVNPDMLSASPVGMSYPVPMALTYKVR